MAARAATTHDPAELLRTPEELRTIREQADAASAPADDRAHALWQLDLILAQLGDVPELVDLHQVDGDYACDIGSRLAYGLCGDCAATAASDYRLGEPPDERADRIRRNAKARRRYRIGDYVVCRTHAIQRIRAGHQLATMTIGRSPERPADLDHWAASVADAGLTERAVTLWLDEWHVDGDQRIGVLERHADRLTALAHTAADEDNWLSQHARVEPGRCDRCRRPTGEQPLFTIGDRALCRRCALATRPRPDHPEEAA